MDTGLLLVIGIALGLGFDLYAKAVCQGALLSRIDKAKLALGLLVCGIYQLIVLLVGYAMTIWFRGSYLADKGEALNPLISMVIFVAFAIKMLKNAWKNEGIVESRHDGKYLIRIFISLCLQVGFYTLLTGIALGMMQLRSIYELGILTVVCIIAVLLGLIGGYRLGYSQKTGAYAIGGSILIIVAVATGFLYL